MKKVQHKYIPAGKNFDYVFQAKDKMVFPRMWDMTNEEGHADYYAFLCRHWKKPGWNL